MDAVTIGNPGWRRREGLDALSEALGAREGETRFVGGVVRDTLLGLEVADIDMATHLEPEAVLKRLRRAGIRAVPTGIAHGTVTAVLPSGPVEVTTLRRDVQTDGRRAVIAYTRDWREDAARRDFTINALYADPLSGQVFDYFGGIEDLRARRVRFIGDPYRRIAEDHLRILRFFRFLARFGDEPEPAGLEACTARARDLMALSRERIADELTKLLVAGGAVGVLRLMVERGILAPVLPEIGMDGVERLARVARREAAFGLAPSPIRRLVALLPQDARTAEAVANRLKLSNASRKRMIAAIGPTDEPPRRLAYRHGVESAIDRLLLSDAPDERVAAGIEELRGFTPPALPISGGAIVRRGVRAGPAVAALLKRVEAQWLEEDFPSAERVEAIADAVVDQWLRETRNA